MHPALMARPQATRAPVSHASQDPDTPYYPNGGVASPPNMIVSPLTMTPGNGQTNELVGPATADWIPMVDSNDQGKGVPPFKRWPRQFHVEAYNFDTIFILPQQDQVGPINPATVNRPTRVGQAAPSYGEQYEQPIASGSLGSIASIRDPATIAYATGWGYIG